MDIKIRKAKNFKEKLFGLMFKKEYPYNLLFPKCSSIHTFWMRFSIDLLCLNKKNEIIWIAFKIKPWRIFFSPKGTYSIIEAQSRLNSFHGLKIGDKLNFK